LLPKPAARRLLDTAGSMGGQSLLLAGSAPFHLAKAVLTLEGSPLVQMWCDLGWATAGVAAVL
jgi:hypothetical protein